MKHLETAVIRTKSMPFACAAACTLSIVIKLAFPKITGIGDTLVLVLILFMLITILDLVYAYMRDIVKD